MLSSIFQVLRRHSLFLTLLAISILLSMHSKAWAKALDASWLVKYPKKWVVQMKDGVSNAMDWLVNDATFGLFTFKEFSRGIAWLIEWPYELTLSLLATGFFEGQGKQAVLLLPSISWLVVIIFVILLAQYAKNWRLAAVVGACFFYLAVFGQWHSAMITLASVLIAVPIGVLGGLWLGILAYRHRWFEQVLSPCLDLMQTIPIFAYLVPILFLFGFGPVSALVATIIYAMPPMVRVTTLALQNVNPEVKEFGTMAGCTDSQLMWHVLIPSANRSLMIGVNQVIMLSLNMVIIASMIGAGGLGFDVLASLRRLDIGAGFEAGIAIVALAIGIDRLSQAFAERSSVHGRSLSISTPGLSVFNYQRTALVLVALLISYLLGKYLPWLQTYPDSLTLTTGSFWNDAIKFLNINYFDQFESIKLFFLKGLMLPIKRFMIGMPWPWVIAMVALIAWRFGGVRLAAATVLMSLFILVNGLWVKAMLTVYLSAASVILAMLIGVPLGVWAGISERAGKAINTLIDTLQTLPSFVYLIPVVMLFRVGDFTALIATVLYALAPAVRYTTHGIKSINSEILEAGAVSGCTGRQLLTHIKLPLALPHILLGLNQTIMLALSMLVITALVGTRDLGQEVYIALTKADTGRGVIAGLAIAFIAITADRILHASSNRAKKRFGLENH